MKEFILLIIVILVSSYFERLGKRMTDSQGEKNYPENVGKQSYRSIFQKHTAQDQQEDNQPWKRRRRQIIVNPGKNIRGNSWHSSSQHSSSLSRNVLGSASVAKNTEGFKAEGYSEEGATFRGEQGEAIVTPQQSEKTEDMPGVDSHVALSAESVAFSLPRVGSMLTGKDLTAAVIWSEILQKPKALRRKS